MLSVRELIEFELHFLQFLEELLQLHLVEIHALRIRDVIALARIGVHVKREFNHGRPDILADDLALLDLGVVEDDFVVLLHLRVLEGHVELPVEILQGMVRAHQLPLKLGHCTRWVLLGFHHD